MAKQKELMRFKILRMNAKKRNINIEFAPPIIQRHCKNISFYYTKSKVIYWTIEMYIMLCPDDESNEINSFKYTFAPNSEKLSLKE